jgi:D-alanine transaminase
MSRIAYVNGRYVPLREAEVSIQDRGFQFGDGVYEVCEIRDRQIIDEDRHLARLARSLGALRIVWPVEEAALRRILREVVALNRVRDGLIYLQITRGVARRDFAFPAEAPKASLVVTAKGTNPAINAAHAAAGVKVITVAETRWAHPHIKSLQLLPSVLAKQAAREAGAFEAWFVDADGFVTEGASSNAWIVTADGAIVTRHADETILRGVTRTTLLDAVRGQGLCFEERPFTPSEAYGAKEAFNSSATTIAMPVVEIDGRPIGDGAPGPLVKALRAAFHTLAQRS